MTLPRLVGINHVALEVADIDAALAFYGGLFEVRLRGRTETAAEIDIGDQFVALVRGRTQPPDAARHVGLVVDDREAVRARLDATATSILRGKGLNFNDPWGNRIQVVDYRRIQFTKAPEVLAGMGLAYLEKTPGAVRELREKGLGC